MATYKVRGNSHTVIYTYRTENGKQKQQWESYGSELEAIQRKAYIDYLQKGKRQNDILAAAMEYQEKHRSVEGTTTVTEKAGQMPLSVPSPKPASSAGSKPAAKRLPVAGEDNTQRTYAEFIERFLPFHARKRRLSPNTYDSYACNLKNHVLPYFGDRIMSQITSEDIDNFLDYLSQKPCQGSKSLRKTPDEAPRLSSSTIKKCYGVLMVGFPTAKKWHYIDEIPETSAPAEKMKKRNAWAPALILEVLTKIEDDPLLHLGVHMAFVCSLRAGEVVGLQTSAIDFADQSMWITQILQRVSDKALQELPKEEIIKVFPKKLSRSKTSLILKDPKTDGSYRKQYLTAPLLEEIRKRMESIEENKKFFGAEYQDNGLLFCWEDGTPLEPHWLDRTFKKRQTQLGITNQIEFQGLRKSGQMHKVRLTKNNYQLVAENSGQSPEVLMSNYNEALESEKRNLSQLVETSFYSSATGTDPAQTTEEQAQTLLRQMQQNPDLSRQFMQLLLSGALNTP